MQKAPVFHCADHHVYKRQKLGRIRDHLDGLLIDMAANLYSGKIDAEPLCVGNK